MRKRPNRETFWSINRSLRNLRIAKKILTSDIKKYSSSYAQRKLRNCACIYDIFKYSCQWKYAARACICIINVQKYGVLVNCNKKHKYRKLFYKYFYFILVCNVRIYKSSWKCSLYPRYAKKFHFPSFAISPISSIRPVTPLVSFQAVLIAEAYVREYILHHDESHKSVLNDKL